MSQYRERLQPFVELATEAQQCLFSGTEEERSAIGRTALALAEEAEAAVIALERAGHFQAALLLRSREHRAAG